MGMSVEKDAAAENHLGNPSGGEAQDIGEDEEAEDLPEEEEAVPLSSSACVEYPRISHSEEGKLYSLCFPINIHYPNLVEPPEDLTATADSVHSEHLTGYGLFDYKNLFVFKDNKAEDAAEEKETGKRSGEESERRDLATHHDRGGAESVSLPATLLCF